MASIRYLRQHPKTGLLHYRRVIPPHLRAHVGVGTISRSLGARTLNHTALSRWIEADREAEQRLADARVTVGKTVTATVMPTVIGTASPIVANQIAGTVSTAAPILIDAQACMAALAI